MNQGQEQFFEFIMSSVKADSQKEAKNLLNCSFKLQSEGKFTKNELEEFHQKISGMLKPECKDNVMAVLNQFGQEHI